MLFARRRSPRGQSSSSRSATSRPSPSPPPPQPSPTDARPVRNRGGVFTADPDVDASGDITGAAATEGVARVDPRVRVAVGEPVTFVVDVDRLHFFDIETGDAIGTAADSRAVPVEP